MGIALLGLGEQSCTRMSGLLSIIIRCITDPLNLGYNSVRAVVSPGRETKLQERSFVWLGLPAAHQLRGATDGGGQSAVGSDRGQLHRLRTTLEAAVVLQLPAVGRGDHRGGADALEARAARPLLRDH